MTVGATGGRGAARDVRTVVLDARGQGYADEARIVERGLRARPGVLRVSANPVAQTVLVEYDAAAISMDDLREVVRGCGYICSGECVPRHLCAVTEEPEGVYETSGSSAGHQALPREPAGREVRGVASVHPSVAVHEAAREQSPAAVGAHAGHTGHDEMSMAAMARALRDRFFVAVVLAVPIALYSPLGRDALGLDLPTPFGLDVDVFQFLLSLPVVFYASAVFFRGAWIALKAHTLDMMVLVAVAIGAGWLYSVAATFFIEGEVFYEAAAFLAAFVLLGHWFEMRARGGANEALRGLLELAPPMALVLRERRDPWRCPPPTCSSGTSWCEPGARSPSTARSSPARARSTSRW